MTTLALLLFMSSLTADSAVIAPKSSASENIIYEAIVEALDGALSHGFVTNLDDSSITISQKGQIVLFADTIKYLDTNIAKITLIRLKGNRAGSGAWKGAAIGFSIGALAGLIGTGSGNGILQISAGEVALAFGAALGLVGLLIGCLIGALHKKKYKFIIDGSKENFNDMLLRLNYKKDK